MRIALPMLFFPTLFLAVSCGSEQASEDADLPAGLYARIETPRGAIVAALEYEKTPMTVMNFIGLAEGTLPFRNRSGRYYYDGLTFHRVIKDFMIQGGCPYGTGQGDPGYAFPDEFHPALVHDRAGVLSMANSGPNTNGSQFFITHAPTPWLDGKHSVFGRVVKGQEVVNKVVSGDLIQHVAIIRRGPQAEKFSAQKDEFDKLIAEAPGRHAAVIQAEIDRRWPDLKKNPSGLLYKVTREGKGENPKKGAEIVFHYRGSFLSGGVFDESYQRNEPAQARIDNLIAGMREALLSMKKGEQRVLVIPPELGYGAQGAFDQTGRPVIPPNSWIVFEVELVDF